MPQRFQSTYEDCMDYAVSWPQTESGEDVEFPAQELGPEEMVALAQELATYWGANDD